MAMTESERKAYLLNEASTPLSVAERDWLRGIIFSGKLTPYEAQTLQAKFPVEFAKHHAELGGGALSNRTEEPWVVCPACGSRKVDQGIDISRSVLLSREATRPSHEASTGCLALLAAPFTLGLSIVALGGYSIAKDAGRALSAADRNRAVEAEERRCAVMTCRVCNRRWMAEDWDEIHAHAEN